MTFESECLQKRNEKNARLTTLVKHYKKYNPLWDEQILLAGVVNCLIKNNFKVSKREIYYTFKKNYNKDFHGDVNSYCKWLYSLAQPDKNISYNSITGTQEASGTQINQSLRDYARGGLKPLQIWFENPKTGVENGRN